MTLNCCKVEFAVYFADLGGNTIRYDSRV